MKTYVFLNDRYADWEIGYVLPELHRNGKEIHTFGLSKAQITSGGSLRVIPEMSLDEVRINRGDLLLLCGGWFWKEFESSRLDYLVRSARKDGAVVAGICAASGYMAKIGLLDDVKHTSNSVEFLLERAPEYKGEDHYKKDMAVCDQDIITAGGLGAIDFTYEILKRLEVYTPEECKQWYRAFKFGEEPT
jgi:putative intracellular protease/amidase